MGHRWFFLFGATVLLTGCSGDSSNSGSQPVNSAAFLTDVGEQAIGSSGTPGDRPGAQGVETGDAITTEADAGTAVNFGCEGNEDCGPGEVCDCAKACVPEGFLPCEEDKNCGSGSYCDGCTGMCYALKQLCELKKMVEEQMAQFQAQSEAAKTDAYKHPSATQAGVAVEFRTRAVVGFLGNRETPEVLNRRFDQLMADAGIDTSVFE